MKTKEELKAMNRYELEDYADRLQNAEEMKEYYYKKVCRMEKLLSAMHFVLESNKDLLK